ncbi:DUF4288 domain-containing protein [Flammeovirga pectinis]|uniref:DUF4288 domain-containing protein n=1 Tax=Flammeovirga pectinis TaxID=2494373 RepID=A0A3Q9FS59_9BACT|nr:DUF4288 domain-containing protein [Flammeovirga pectinis]AZQ63937.1 DUF4288 domain-containing protein [Flammeovirga pectinis]
MLYGVKNIYRFSVEGEPDKTLIDSNYEKNYQAFEESIMLVIADSFERAYEIAELKAKKAEDTYTNCYGQTVKYRFIDSIDCYSISENELEDGMELYSNIVSLSK